MSLEDVITLFDANDDEAESRFLPHAILLYHLEACRESDCEKRLLAATNSIDAEFVPVSIQEQVKAIY
jgi:hypothetical protein